MFLLVFNEGLSWIEVETSGLIVFFFSQNNPGDLCAFWVVTYCIPNEYMYEQSKLFYCHNFSSLVLFIAVIWDDVGTCRMNYILPSSG